MNKFKKIMACTMAITTMAVGMTSVNASAYAPTDETVAEVSVDSSDVSTYSTKTLSFSGVTSAGSRIGTFTISSARTVTFSFTKASGAAAHVTIFNNSTDADCGSFTIPTTSAATMTTSKYLSSGTYYLFVTPVSGSSTSGGVTITY